MATAHRKLLDGVTQSFPVIAATNTTGSAAGTSTYALNLPSGITSGDLLFITVQVKTTGRPITSFSQTWTALTSNAGSSRETFMYWRIADGTEGSTTTATFSGNQDVVASLAYRITGAQSVEVGTYATGSSSSPNPPSLSPSWGSAKTLWAIYIGVADSRQTLSSYPSNYTLSQITAAGNASNSTGQEAWLAGYQNEASSEDPGTGTLSASLAWVAQTIAFRPS